MKGTVVMEIPNICKTGPVNLVKKKLVYAKCNKDFFLNHRKYTCASPIWWADPDHPLQKCADSCGSSTQTAWEEPGGPPICLHMEEVATEEKKHKCGKCTFIKRFITKQRSTLLYVANIEPPGVPLPPSRSCLALIRVRSRFTSCLFNSSSFVLMWWPTKSSSFASFPCCDIQRQDINRQ